MHGKELVIAPPFNTQLGVEVKVANIDTDSYGTFTGDVPRTLSPRMTAIAKARAGMTYANLPLGIANEGTIGPDPAIPFLIADYEIVALIDDDLGFELVEVTRSTGVIAVQSTFTVDDDLTEFLITADFPRHGLIVRPSGGPLEPIVKGIVDPIKLRTAIKECAKDTGRVKIESDLRALHSPSRMAAIGRCADQLTQRLATQCPACFAPGWGKTENVLGVPCRKCNTLVTTQIRAERYGCVLCTEVLDVPRVNQYVEPQWCPSCNP
jgi:hypothetical protein